MNNRDTDGREVERRNNGMIPAAMMFVTIGMMFVVFFLVSSEPHGGAVAGIFGTNGLGHWLLIVVGIAFEIVGAVIAMKAAAAAKKN